MSLSAIRDEYRVPARLGARVSWYNARTGHTRLGTVIGSKNDRIRVRFDAGHALYILPKDLTFHPTTEEN